MSCQRALVKCTRDRYALACPIHPPNAPEMHPEGFYEAAISTFSLVGRTGFEPITPCASSMIVTRRDQG